MFNCNINYEKSAYFIVIYCYPQNDWIVSEAKMK